LHFFRISYTVCVKISRKLNAVSLIDNSWLSVQDQLEPDLAYHQYAARIPDPPPVHHAAAFSNPAYERFAAERILPPAVAGSTATAGYERGSGSGPARTAAPPQGHRRTPSGSSGVYYEERSGGSSGEYSDRPPPLAPRQAHIY
jgi:hypothetical protein